MNLVNYILILLKGLSQFQYQLAKAQRAQEIKPTIFKFLPPNSR